MSHLRLGDSLDKAIDMGAVVDAKQYEAIDYYVRKAREEGNDVYQACACIPSTGLFYPPTLITNVDTCSTVVQEEIFGPVVTAQSFRTAKEAVALANNSTFGLGGSVWSENMAKTLEVSRCGGGGGLWFAERIIETSGVVCAVCNEITEAVERRNEHEPDDIGKYL